MVKSLIFSLIVLICVSSAVFAAEPIKLTDYQMSKIQGAAFVQGYAAGVAGSYAIGYVECSAKYGIPFTKGFKIKEHNDCVHKVASESLTDIWNIMGGFTSGMSVGAKKSSDYAKAVDILDKSLTVKDIIEFAARLGKLRGNVTLDNASKAWWELEAARQYAEQTASITAGERLANAAPARNMSAVRRDDDDHDSSSGGSSSSGSTGSSGSSSSSSGSTSSSRTSSGFGSSPSTTVSTAARTVVSSTGSLRDYSPEMARAIALR